MLVATTTMSTNPPILSSAVIVPDAEERPSTPPLSAKRRQSSVSADGSKRPRLSAPLDRPRDASASSAQPGTAAKEQGAKDLEERKRGKRLFGALLGALNQSSPSVAQRRRGDIERKQREKLKVREREHDDQQRKNREALLQTRRREQDLYNEQAMRTRNSNTMAMAHFLHTRSEPKLYYKPWDLLPEQKARIEEQVSEVQNAVNVSLAKEAGSSPGSISAAVSLEKHLSNKYNQPDVQHNRTGDATDIGHSGALERDRADSADKQHSNGKSNTPIRRLTPDDSRDGADDAGDDFVKGDEDDVIY